MYKNNFTLNNLKECLCFKMHPTNHYNNRTEYKRENSTVDFKTRTDYEKKIFKDGALNHHY